MTWIKLSDKRPPNKSICVVRDGAEEIIFSEVCEYNIGKFRADGPDWEWLQSECSAHDTDEYMILWEPGEEP